MKRCCQQLRLFSKCWFMAVIMAATCTRIQKQLAVTESHGIVSSAETQAGPYGTFFGFYVRNFRPSGFQIIIRISFLLKKSNSEYCWGTVQQFKSIVRRKPKRVKNSGLIRQLFLRCLAANIFYFYLKGHYSLKSIKPGSAFNEHKN